MTSLAGKCRFLSSCRYVTSQKSGGDGWAQNADIPARRPGGEACPICSLGECGDVNCPSYRPKQPEVRAAVEDAVLQHAKWLGSNLGKRIGWEKAGNIYGMIMKNPWYDGDNSCWLLVGGWGWATPLKNMKVNWINWDDVRKKTKIHGKIKN